VFGAIKRTGITSIKLRNDFVGQPEKICPTNKNNPEKFTRSVLHEDFMTVAVMWAIEIVLKILDRAGAGRQCFLRPDGSWY
jgi:hypothetical protein